MIEKILLVDDEPSVLDGYKRTLHREFQVETAVGAEQGLSSLQYHGPFAVVISDMRMPGMSGAEFLAQVRHIAPDTVRMLLTGFTDLDAAVQAVNEGNIFRFLTKPCSKEVLTSAITAGLEQYRLVVAEKELLEKTLMGSIKVLVDVTSAASPEAFGRSTRIARYVRHLVANSALTFPWRFEAAAMLSQLGCVSLSPELIRKAYCGAQLSPSEKIQFANHPQVARDLLAKIPRLEAIAWMISQQLSRQDAETAIEGAKKFGEDIAFGTTILQLAVGMDGLRSQGLSSSEAMAKLREAYPDASSILMEALAEMEPEEGKMELRTILTSMLRPGMILQQDIKSATGMVVVPMGFEVTQTLVLKLDNYCRLGTIDEEVLVLAPA